VSRPTRQSPAYPARPAAAARYASQRLPSRWRYAARRGSPTGITEKKPAGNALGAGQISATKCATPPALGKWRPAGKDNALPETPAQSAPAMPTGCYSGHHAASAGTAKTPVPNKEVESRPTPVPAPTPFESTHLHRPATIKERRW
jgi:hypothetical protein